jgi:hypothetical protein
MASSAIKESLKAFVIWLRKKIPNFVLGLFNFANAVAEKTLATALDLLTKDPG